MNCVMLFVQRLVLFISALLFFFGANAQTASRISGFVVTAEKDPMPLVTVRLVAGNGLPSLAGTYTNTKGHFELVTKLTGTHLLQFSYTGYNDTLIAVDLGKDILLNDIILTASAVELKAVTVTGAKRLIQVRNDGISYLAENDPMANTDKALDLLSKTPMVSVDGAGKVTVNGQSSFKVLVNGRETALFARDPGEALKHFPGSIIKRIDIITTPSAKYDAEGVGGVIDIITKKNVAGYSASLTASANFFDPFDLSTRNSRNIDGSLNLKKGKTGFVLGFDAGNQDNSLSRRQETIQPLVVTSFTQRTGNAVTRGSGYSPQFNSELSYDLDSLNTLIVYGAYNRRRDQDAGESDYLLTGTTAGTVTSQLFSNDSSRTLDWSTGLDYVRKFRSNPAKEFSVKLFGLFGDRDLNNTGSEFNSTGINRFILNQNESHDKQYTIQADYILPGKKKRSWEIGVKAILRRATSDYQSYLKNMPGDVYQLNAGNSDNFIYDQDVYSAYASRKFSIGKFNIVAGVRMEHTVINGDFIASHTRVDQQYTRWLPNILVSRQLKNGHFISFSYSQRLNRPYISSLNPFVNNIDSLNVSTGNPFLNPQLSHVGNIQYRISSGKIFTTISMGYTYSNSYILYGYLFNKATGVTTSQPQNGGISNSVFVNVSLNANLSERVRFTTNESVSYLEIKSPALGGQQNQGFYGRLGGNGTYMAAGKVTLTAFINYYFPTLLLQGGRTGYYAYGFGGRYIFIKNTLSLNLSLNNVFNKNGEFPFTEHYANQSFSTEIKTISLFRGIDIGLTWNFGKLNDNISKKKGVSNTDLL